MMTASPRQVMPAHRWLLLLGMAVISTPLNVTVAPAAIFTWVSLPPVPVSTLPLYSITSLLSEVSVSTLFEVVTCM